MLITIMESAPSEDRRPQTDTVIGRCHPGGNPGRLAALHDLMARRKISPGPEQSGDLFLGKAPKAGNHDAGWCPDPALRRRQSARGAYRHCQPHHRRVQEQQAPCPDSMVEELKTLRAMANRIVLGIGKYLTMKT